MLDKQIQYYNNNKEHFREKYNGKYIVIKGKEVIGVYDTHDSAFAETVKLHEIGSFIIEHPVKRKGSLP